MLRRRGQRGGFAAASLGTCCSAFALDMIEQRDRVTHGASPLRRSNTATQPNAASRFSTGLRHHPAPRASFLLQTLTVVGMIAFIKVGAAGPRQWKQRCLLAQLRELVAAFTAATVALSPSRRTPT
jgi:hypothetical protein